MIESVIGDYRQFLRKIADNFEDSKLDVSNYQMDHIAYRATTSDSYESIMNQLKDYGNVIGVKIIRDRPISIVKLNDPLKFENYTVTCLEVLAPAQSDQFKEGLEHVEIVINDISLEEFVTKYPHLNFEAKGHGINPEMVLYFPDGTSVKFHSLPIEEVIKLEN